MFTAIQPRLNFHLNRMAGKSQPRVVFLHIPKCGGTSVNHHFKTNFGGSRTGRSVILDSASGNVSDAASLSHASKAYYVSGHFGWSALERVREGAIAFTVMREPFDRLKALYLFARKPRRIGNPAFEVLAHAAAQMGFDEFCLCNDPRIQAFVDNAMTRTLACDYYPFREGDQSADLQIAKRHLEEFDFVADVTTLSRALPRIAEVTRTTLAEGKDWRNRSASPARVDMTRGDFSRDPQLSARLAMDFELYEHALGLAL